MEWLISRVLVTLGRAAAGSVALGLLGMGFGRPILGAVVGSVVGVALGIAAEASRGQRLLDWLRGPLRGDAPRDKGLWGEVAYRIERLLQAHGHALRHSDERLQQFLSAIEASPNGVMLLGGADQIDWCNSVAAQHFGLDPKRDRLQRVTNLVRSPTFVAYLQAGQFDEPVVFAAPEGRATLSVLVRPYGDALKLVLSQDITERERAEAMRRDFVANVSHEIRTPLTVLSGFVETLAGLPLTEVERRRVYALMEQQTDRIQGLVGDLLTLAQLEGSPRPGSERWVEVGSLLRRATSDARALSMNRHQIEVRGGEGVELAGSEHELFSAVSNLLSNAVRYTPAGGSIHLSWLDHGDGGGEIEVRDTGIGVAKEHLSRLTERFYRVDGSRSRDTGGTGLGLSIVKHAVQRHGGQIDMQSDLGRGSTFKLSFPAVRTRRTGAVAADEESLLH